MEYYDRYVFYWKRYWATIPHNCIQSWIIDSFQKDGKIRNFIGLTFPVYSSHHQPTFTTQNFYYGLSVEWETCIRGILYVKNVWIRDTCYTLIMHYVFRVWEKYHAAHQFWVSEATPFDTLHDENVKRKLVVCHIQ